MSHSSLDDLVYYLDLAKKVGIPFIIDTEGSQVRTGYLSSSEPFYYKENDSLCLHKEEVVGDKNNISIRPSQILDQLNEGDILYVDFDTLVLRINDTSSIEDRFIQAKVLSSGLLGNNKGIVVDSKINKKFDIPTLTTKDIKAIKIGLKYNISFVAASFIRNRDDVKYIKKLTNNKMKIISKIECLDALEKLDEIINESDYLLIDRGDLSKEIPIEKIPFTQKIILNRAKKHNTKVFVATNLLESMILNRKPTRAEVHDVINTILDGAYGLTLAAETAIGNYPIGCINMLNKIINHSNLIINKDEVRDKENFFVKDLENRNYLIDNNISSLLVNPHGENLVNRVNKKSIKRKYLNTLLKIKLNSNQEMDLEQIAIGAYSPLEGFLNKEELDSVLEKMRLPTGIIWSIPILLDIKKSDADKINKGDTVALFDNLDRFIATIEINDKFNYDKKIICLELYGTNDPTHPGVKLIKSLKPIFIGGKISYYKKYKNKYDKYSLTPRQTRRLFDEKNWSRVAGFHTRNVIHRAHEFIQLSALEKGKCDGLFIHPVVGKKKTGDFNSEMIIKSYEIMQSDYYPDNKIIFGVLSTYSRYAGEREAIFTALCRKNYGCSHFIVGRDHTGVGHSNNTYEIFSQFPDLGIEIIKFDTVNYYKNQKRYFEETDEELNEDTDEKISISGSEAREMFEQRKVPPNWYMRSKISSMIIESLNAQEKVFV